MTIRILSRAEILSNCISSFVQFHKDAENTTRRVSFCHISYFRSAILGSFLFFVSFISNIIIIHETNANELSLQEKEFLEYEIISLAHKWKKPISIMYIGGKEPDIAQLKELIEKRITSVGAEIDESRNANLLVMYGKEFIAGEYAREIRRIANNNIDVESLMRIVDFNGVTSTAKLINPNQSMELALLYIKTLDIRNKDDFLDSSVTDILGYPMLNLENKSFIKTINTNSYKYCILKKIYMAKGVDLNKNCAGE